MNSLTQKNISVVSWNGLPCLVLDDKAIVFSYINDKFVCSSIPVAHLNDVKMLELATQIHFFDCLDNKEVRDVPVKQVTLCLTERCNSRCKYCFLDANTTGDIMSVETMHSALDFAFTKYSGLIVVVSAFGGEPGTKEALIKEMVSYSESIKDKYNVTPEYAITTNGVISDSLIDFLIEYKFTCTISTDGIREVQNYQRPLANGKPSFDFVYHTLSRLSRSGVYVKIRSTVTEYSVGYMAESVEMYGKLGIRQIHFEPVTSAGRALSTSAVVPPSVEDYAQQIIRSIDVAALYGSKINFSFCSRCTGALKNKIIVGAKGLVSSCVEVQNENHEFSRYFKTGNISSNGIVTCSDNPHIISSNSRGNSDQSKCVNCPYKIFCMDTCPIRNFRATGEFHKTEPFKCDLYHILLPEILYRFYKQTFSINSN